MIKFARHLLVLLILALLILQSASPGNAQGDPDGLSMSVQAGFEGYYKEKTWMPVTIRLENTGANIDGVLEVSLDDYIQTDVVYRYPIELPTTSRKEISLTVYPEVSARAVQVKLLVGKQVLGKAEARLKSLSPNDPLFGVLSASSSAFNLLSELDNLGELTGSAAVAVLDRAAFPTRSQALDALSVLILCNPDSTGSAGLSPEQVRSLQEWTAAGGRLVITGGPSWQKTTAGLESSGLLPLIPSGDRIAMDMQPVAAFARQAQANTPPLDEPGMGIVITQGDLHPQARVLASTGTITGAVPLIVQMDYGAGSVSFLAFDPTLEPFANWNGLTSFYRQLLGNPLNKPGWLGGFRDWYAAQNAAQSMPGIHLPSFWLIFGMLGLYVVLLGPANYLLLRLLKRRELGWISLPLTVILCAALVFVVGSISRSGGAMVGRISIMQIWPGVETGRVNSLVSLYSPNRAAYEVELPAPALIHRIPTDPPAPAQALVYTQDERRMHIRGLRMDSGDLAPFAVDTVAPVPELEVTAQLDVTQDQVQLTGKISNHSDLTLETTVVHTPAGSQELGRIGPGQSADFIILLNSQRGRLQQVQPVPMPPFNYPIQIANPGPDAIISSILGTTDYYQVPEMYWRHQLLFAALGGYNYLDTNLGGLFLTAWSEVAPYELTLPGEGFRTQDATLYVLKLVPALTLSEGTLSLAPGFFSRRFIENTLYSGTPFYIYSGQYLIFEDSPIVPLSFSDIRALSLHLISTVYSGSIRDLAVSLWDTTAGEWVVMEDLTWGSNSIQDPGRFVSAAGGVRVKVEGTSAQGTQLDNIEISLVVEH